MPQAESSFSWKKLLPLFPIYVIVLAINGYVFGTDDQVEVLPYALFLGDSSLYSSDFYVQYISQAIPNERYFFSKLLSFAGFTLPWICSLLHLLCSLVLFAGIYRISHLFIRSEAMKWGVLLLLFLPPLYGINLGGNELYYNTFIPSLLAKSIGAWALYYFLCAKYRWSIATMILCTFFHPVAGAQLFLILGGVLFFEKISQRDNISWKKMGALLLAFMASAGAWVLFLKLNFDKGNIAPNLLFEIMEFRVPHHYFPSYYPVRSYLLLLPLFAFGGFYFWKKEKQVFTFFLLALLGCAIYTLGIEVLKSTTLLTAQWFKSTIWLKAFSIIAVLASIESNFSFFQNAFFKKIAPLGLVILTVVAIIGMAAPFSLFQNRPYHFPWQITRTASVSIAQQVQEKTPTNATFVIPIMETAFKFHSQRSCYIDYKTMVHRKDALPVWYQRVKEIYGVDIRNRRAGADLNNLSMVQFNTRNEAEWRALSAGRFDHLLIPKERGISVLDFPVIAENERFWVYRVE